MSKKTIVYIGGFELPDKNAAAHRVMGNAKILRALGYKVVFIGITKENINTPVQINNQDFDMWSIQYPRTTLEMMKYLSTVAEVKEIVAKYQNVQGIIAYNYPAIALQKIKKYGIKNEMKIYADCTEWYHSSGKNSVFNLIKNTDSYLRMRIIQPKLDGVIVISSFLEEFYLKKGVINVVNLPPLVDKSENKWLDKQEKIQNSDELNIVYAGSPGAEKDKLNYIIEALSNLDCNQYTFNIIGITDSVYLELNPTHKVLLEQLENKVSFKGRIAHADALNAVKQADFTLFIRDETVVTKAGFPTKFAESFSAGTPVITNLSSDLDKYLVNNENGIVITENLDIELDKIFKSDIMELKSMKKNVNNNIFDYRNYIEVMQKLLD